jgi:hypothetical protein
MRRSKFTTGEIVEVRCFHRRAGQLVSDWLAGRVVQVDHRMAAIQFDVDVYSNNGWLIPDRTLWCAHGSPNVRRVESSIDEPA